MVKEGAYGEGGCHHALLTILKASREHQDMEKPGNGYLVVMFPENNLHYIGAHERSRL